MHLSDHTADGSQWSFHSVVTFTVQGVADHVQHAYWHVYVGMISLKTSRLRTLSLSSPPGGAQKHKTAISE